MMYCEIFCSLSFIYSICGPTPFTFIKVSSPSKSSPTNECLTSPSIPVHNNGDDNIHHNLILSRNAVISKCESIKYIVKDSLGSGTFGQVFRCIRDDREYAVKVIKSDMAYLHHGFSEVKVLKRLLSSPQNSSYFSEYYDDFIFKNHMCIVMERLGKNLFEILEAGGFRGLDHNVVKRIAKQILNGIEVLNRMGVIHCDLKPENILVSDPENIKIKIIDFGNALDNKKGDMFYVQSRYYRAPEVLLGLTYDFSIDMWSFGCIVYELFIGTPLFPGCNSEDMINRMVCFLGYPPNFMIEYGIHSNKYFKKSFNELYTKNNKPDNFSTNYYTTGKNENINHFHDIYSSSSNFKNINHENFDNMENQHDHNTKNKNSVSSLNMNHENLDNMKNFNDYNTKKKNSVHSLNMNHENFQYKERKNSVNSINTNHENFDNMKNFNDYNTKKKNSVHSLNMNHENFEFEERKNSVNSINTNHENFDNMKNFHFKYKERKNSVNSLNMNHENFNNMKNFHFKYKERKNSVNSLNMNNENFDNMKNFHFQYKERKNSVNSINTNHENFDIMKNQHDYNEEIKNSNNFQNNYHSAEKNEFNNIHVNDVKSCDNVNLNVHHNNKPKNTSRMHNSYDNKDKNCDLNLFDHYNDNKIINTSQLQNNYIMNDDYFNKDKNSFFISHYNDNKLKNINYTQDSYSKKVNKSNSKQKKDEYYSENDHYTDFDHLDHSFHKNTLGSSPNQKEIYLANTKPSFNQKLKKLKEFDPLYPTNNYNENIENFSNNGRHNHLKENIPEKNNTQKPIYNKSPHITTESSYIINDFPTNETYITKNKFIEKCFRKSQSNIKNNQFINLVLTVLKFNHLKRPLAFQIKDHPYFDENEIENTYFNYKSEKNTSFVRNQPNPAPKDNFIRRYSINEPSINDTNKNIKEFTRKRIQSQHDIKYRKNHHPFNENKHNK